MGDAVCFSELYRELLEGFAVRLEGVNEVLECSLCLMSINGSDILLFMIEDILFVAILTLLIPTVVVWMQD